MFDKVSQDVTSFGALPREAWLALGILELLCTGGIIVPAALHWQPSLTILAATVLAVESLVFVGGTRQVPRGHAHDIERRAGPAHGVHRIRPDGSEADLLTGWAILDLTVVVVVRSPHVTNGRAVPSVESVWSRKK